MTRADELIRLAEEKVAKEQYGLATDDCINYNPSTDTCKSGCPETEVAVNEICLFSGGWQEDCFCYFY